MPGAQSSHGSRGCAMAVIDARDRRRGRSGRIDPQDDNATDPAGVGSHTPVVAGKLPGSPASLRIAR
jgi:hypothetical protein